MADTDYTSVMTGWVDPVLYDVDEDDLVDAALTEAGATLPEFTARDGTIELALIRATALQVAEVVYAVNRLPERTLEGVMGLRGVVRDEGAPPVATVRLTVTNSTGVTVPAGTTLRLQLAATGETYDFTTDMDAAVAVGSTTTTVTATGATVGSTANGTGTGTGLDVVDPVPYVESAVLTVAVSGGRDRETDAAWWARGVAALSRMTSALVLADHFRAYAAEKSYVGRAWVADGYDPAYDGTGNAAVFHASHVGVVVVGPDGAVVSDANMTQLQAEMQARAVAGLTVHVVAPAWTDVTVNATVTTSTGANAAQLLAAVTAAVQSWVNPLTWGGQSKVYVNELISVIDQAAGVGRVVSLATPAADIALTAVRGLPRYAGATVTVQAGS